jgi:hypothetical protein
MCSVCPRYVVLRGVEPRDMSALPCAVYLSVACRCPRWAVVKVKVKGKKEGVPLFQNSMRKECLHRVPRPLGCVHPSLVLATPGAASHLAPRPCPAAMQRASHAKHTYTMRAHNCKSRRLPEQHTSTAHKCTHAARRCTAATGTRARHRATQPPARAQPPRPQRARARHSTARAHAARMAQHNQHQARPMLAQRSRRRATHNARTRTTSTPTRASHPCCSHSRPGSSFSLRLASRSFRVSSGSPAAAPFIPPRRHPT